MRSKIFALALLCLASCGRFRLEGEDREYSFDGVKLVQEGHAAPFNAAHFVQEQYSLSPTSRLLLRLESFSEHSKSISVEKDHRVMVQLTLVNESDSALASDCLRLCPLRRDWMMLATWYRAHPFSDAGKWETPGGDYDPASCVARANAPEDKDGNPSRLVHFDATRWYKDYPRGRGQNFGFVLISSRPMAVYGEKSGTYSPRILFNIAETWIQWSPTPAAR